MRASSAATEALPATWQLGALSSARMRLEDEFERRLARHYNVLDRAEGRYTWGTEVFRRIATDASSEHDELRDSVTRCSACPSSCVFFFLICSREIFTTPLRDHSS